MKGLLIVLSGPSGVGKGTIRKVLMKNDSLKLSYSVSMTTRLPRAGEVDGEDYFFVTKDEFIKHINNNDLLEYASFVDNYYGTPKDYVEKLRNEGRNVLLEIETTGARQVMEQVKNDDKFVSIFLLPPTFSDLEARIRGRKSEPENIIQERLQKAKMELGLKDLYKYNVVNKTPEQAAEEIAEIIKAASK